MKKRIISSITIFFVIIILTSVCFAQASIGASLEGNKEELKPNEEIFLQIKFENYQEISAGINSYKATLEYDKNVFETVTQNNFNCENNWTNLQYNEENQQFIAIKKAGSIEPETVANVTLTVKSDAKQGDTTIELKEITASEGMHDISIADATLTINIINETPTTPPQEDESDKPTTPPQDDDNKGDEDTPPQDDEDDKPVSPPQEDDKDEDKEEPTTPPQDDESDKPTTPPQEDEEDKPTTPPQDDESDKPATPPQDDDKDEGKEEPNTPPQDENDNKEENEENKDVEQPNTPQDQDKEEINNPEDTNKEETNNPLYNDKEPENLPNTGGFFNSVLIIVIIEILAIIAYIFYRKSTNKESKFTKKQKLIISFVIVAILALQFVVSVYASSLIKGELNGDEETNDIDINLLQLHLIDKQQLPIEKIENADMNSDTKITITDVSLLIQKIEIELNRRMYQFKDIQKISLYGQNGESLTSVNIEDLENLDNYLVRLEMKDLPAFYTTIEETKVENDVLKFVLKYDNVVQYEEKQKSNQLEVVYGPVENNIATNDVALVEETPTTSDIYIPDQTRLKNLPDYDTKKETAYSNMYKLMPFYDAKYLVSDGNKIEETDVLNTKTIKDILPFDENNQLVLALTSSDYQKIKKIKVLFNDNTTKNYNVNYDSYYGNIASYKIEELGIYYNFNRYVIQQTEIIDKLVQYIQALDYTKDLDLLTSEENSRLYRDYYNETTINDAYDFVLKLLENDSNYTVTLENNILSQKIENELITNEKLKEILYAYNYYKRWYNIKIGDILVNDILMFQGTVFNKTMTANNMVEEVLAQNSNRNTSATQTFYAKNIAKYTELSNIGEFLDYFITVFGEYEDVNDWFTQNYQGLVYEVEIKGKPEIEYRAWRQLKNRNNFLLPFLTLPKDSAYIISSPTQFLVGAQRTYISDPTDPAQQEELKTKVQEYAKLIESFYTTASGFIEKEYLNKHTDFQLDHRFTKKADGTSEYQEPQTTEEPFHKNFNEAVNFWAAANGSAAYANGTSVFWNVYSALTSFSTWSHESGHNQDGKVFLKGNGRRPSGWAEDYADGNTTQGFGDGGMNFNLSYNYGLDAEVTTNLTPQRIDSTEKIESYYKGMFEASDFLDYIEAKAFLTLTPEEQSKVAVQVYYPNKEEGTAEEKEAGDEVTGWRVLTKEDFEKMNLQTIEDIWDNQITIKPGVTGVSTLGTNRYGAESIYTRYWYQPHNDNGRPDSYTLKHLAWEMLGFAGYDNGYVTYYSGKSKTDLEAIRTITNDPTMTWKQYKLERYEFMQSKWEEMSYIDADEILEQYKQALKFDAEKGDRNVTASTNVKRLNYHYLKRVTNDFETDIFAQETQETVIHITTAEEFKDLITKKPNGYFVLDNDIDLSNVTGNKSIIDVTFTGKLDGQGHKITGNTLPIFSIVKFSHINNLVIENSNINMSEAQLGALAKSITISSVENVTGGNLKVVGTGNINEIGGMFGKMEKSIVKDVHVTDTQVEGPHRVGGIAGYANNMIIIEQSSADATVISSGNAVGSFMGQIDNSNVIYCYALGSTKGKQDMGGFTGWAENTIIKNCLSDVDVQSTVSDASGGFIGQARGTTQIKNNVAFGNVQGGYKFDGRTAANLFGDNYSNNYEIIEATGKSTLTRSNIDFTGKITEIELAETTKTEFYTKTLGWEYEIGN